MENTKSVKALKKQLVAAIAMVLVAAIALGSATYAWFVSNNKVTGTTTAISAQSNSAYLVIDKKKTDKASKATFSYVDDGATTDKTAALYPAQVTADGVWKSAYAAATDDAAEKADTRFTIKSTSATEGSAEAAVAEKYAITHKFYIGTGTYDGEFTDLVVSDISLSAPSNAIANAMRVLVKCGTNWQVWKYDAEAGKGVQVKTYKTTADAEEELTGQSTVIASSIKKGEDAEVDVYVYYDGADAKIYSDNLDNLANDCGVTVTFTATPVTHGAK